MAHEKEPEQQKQLGPESKPLGKSIPFWASRGELGPWEQKEGLLARIAELEPILKAAEMRALADPAQSGVAAAYANEAHSELNEAKKALAHKSHPTMRRAAHLGVALSHVDAALNLLVWMAPSDDIKAFLPQMAALAEEHFDSSDPRRIRVTQLAHDLQQPGAREINPSERAFLAETVSLARRLLRRETLRVRSFVRIVALVTVGLFLAAVGVALATLKWEDTVPLCFTPENATMYKVVCPTNSIDVPGAGAPTITQIMSATRPADYLVVEIVGAVAAAIASAAALRRIRGTALPYNVPVVLALLKLPTGALTAPLGLLLMRGGFVPGLSALDSTAQIIAWAIVFGYSQQLFTKLVDDRGQALVDAVRGPASPPAASSPEARP
ncbi:hypothetical protein OG756_14315 [Streptomyces sp. NBC_01310]|uniref:hypothetical protein n=1 Tax=Streptomyces sp. NBC_01310 TaxID=2903820 RepID=UPI0035B65087|nr:hypothetical protein OG756_14315 [Streptomyces sp. NBC_01310]